MRRHALLTFLVVLCGAASLLILQTSTALTSLRPGKPAPLADAVWQKEGELRQLEDRLRRWERELEDRYHRTLGLANTGTSKDDDRPSTGADPIAVRSAAAAAPTASPGAVVIPKEWQTQVDKEGKPVNEAENFAADAAKQLITTVMDEDQSPATGAIRYPKREATLPNWAVHLPLYDPLPQCLSGPPPAHTTRLTRRFSIDIPGPELAKLRKALCVVRYNRRTAFTEVINLFSFRYLPYVLLVDLYGNILASHTFDYLTTLVAPKWVNSTTISGILKRYGEAPAGWVARTVPFLWNVETGQTVRVEFRPAGFLHHDIDYYPATQTFMALHRWVNRDKKSAGYNVLFDDIFEVNMAGQAVWHFNGSAHVPYIASEWTPDGKHPDSDCVDFRIRWCRDHMHGNTVFWDHEEDVIYYNAKHTDSFWKIRKSDQKVLWAVGRYGNMTLLDKAGRRVPKLFRKAHGIEKIGPNLFLIFDNVFNNNGVMGSRWLEIEVDPEKKIAREHNYWVAPPPRYAHQMGDADRMPNGNTIMSITSTDQLTEATPDGQIAWEMTLPAPPHGKGGKWWIYHVERFMLVPLVKLEGGGSKVTLQTGSAEIALQLWNTVRVRYRAKGLVEVFCGAEVLVARPFTFEINWLTTRLALTVPLARLQCGKNDLQVKCTNADDITGELQVNALYLC
eukprot:EG_transcript_3417